LQDGPSTTTRNLSTGIDPATFTQQADQVSEDQLGLDKGQRRDVQRASLRSASTLASPASSTRRRAR
jgi:hypothetical protein